MKTLKELVEARKQEKKNKGPVSFYVDRSVYEEFKKACKGVPPSQIIEDFMKESLKELEKGKKKP